MPQDRLPRLAIAAIDELALLVYNQQLVKISLEQLRNPDADTEDRIGLLLDCYLSRSECFLDNLRMYLEQIRHRVIEPPED